MFDPDSMVRQIRSKYPVIRAFVSHEDAVQEAWRVKLELDTDEPRLIYVAVQRHLHRFAYKNRVISTNEPTKRTKRGTRDRINQVSTVVPLLEDFDGPRRRPREVEVTVEEILSYVPPRYHAALLAMIDSDRDGAMDRLAMETGYDRAALNRLAKKGVEELRRRCTKDSLLSR